MHMHHASTHRHAVRHLLLLYVKASPSHAYKRPGPEPALPLLVLVSPHSPKHNRRSSRTQWAAPRLRPSTPCKPFPLLWIVPQSASSSAPARNRRSCRPPRLVHLRPIQSSWSTPRPPRILPHHSRRLPFTAAPPPRSRCRVAHGHCRLPALALLNPHQPPGSGRRQPPSDRSHPPLATPPPLLEPSPRSGPVLLTHGRRQCPYRHR